MAITWHGLGVHGNAFVPQEMAGDVGRDGPLTQVDHVPQSDYVGMHYGWGVEYRGKANHTNWFHVAMPSLSLYNHEAPKLGEVQIAFGVQGTAVVRQIHLWGGRERLGPPAFYPDLHQTSDWAALFEPEIAVHAFGLGISVLVDFGPSESQITFSGAYARWVTTG